MSTGPRFERIPSMPSETSEKGGFYERGKLEVFKEIRGEILSLLKDLGYRDRNDFELSKEGNARTSLDLKLLPYEEKDRYEDPGVIQQKREVMWDEIWPILLGKFSENIVPEDLGKLDDSFSRIRLWLTKEYDKRKVLASAVMPSPTQKPKPESRPEIQPGELSDYTSGLLNGRENNI